MSCATHHEGGDRVRSVQVTQGCAARSRRAVRAGNLRGGLWEENSLGLYRIEAEHQGTPHGIILGRRGVSGFTTCLVLGCIGISWSSELGAIFSSTSP